MELFEKLNDSLTASWSSMYHYAQEYAKENGNLDVPKRQVYSWKIAGTLTQSQIELLNNIGMRRESVRDLSWERNYAAAKQCYKEHGNLLVRVRDEQGNSDALGRWIWHKAAQEFHENTVWQSKTLGCRDKH